MIRYHEDVNIHSSQRLFLDNLSKILGLSLIVDGQKGLQIRLWIWKSDTGYAVTFKLDSSRNECNIIEFYDKKIDTSDYIVISNGWKNLKPKSGWDDIHYALAKYNILTMTSGKSYEEQKEITTHMAYVQFEIAKHNEYKYYEYLEPSYYRYVDTESKNVYDFLEYVNEQLGVQIYNPPKDMFIKPN